MYSITLQYNSRGNQNYEGFNQDSSYRSQYNDQEGEENSSSSSIYKKYLQLQIRMLKQTASLQGLSTNSDEFSASQSGSANSSQLGYNQTTPSSVMTLPVVAPQGPSSSNELGNQQGPTSSREVQPLTPSLSSSLSVRQSTMQLTCCGTTRNFRKIRLQSSLLNCDYTLQVLQHISTRCNQRLICNDVCVCFYYSNNTQVQTATFQTNGLRSVRLYVHNT